MKVFRFSPGDDSAKKLRNGWPESFKGNIRKSLKDFSSLFQAAIVQPCRIKVNFSLIEKVAGALDSLGQLLKILLIIKTLNLPTALTNCHR